MPVLVSWLSFFGGDLRKLGMIGDGVGVDRSSDGLRPVTCFLVLGSGLSPDVSVPLRRGIPDCLLGLAREADLRRLRRRGGATLCSKGVPRYAAVCLLKRLAYHSPPYETGWEWEWMIRVGATKLLRASKG